MEEGKDLVPGWPELRKRIVADGDRTFLAEAERFIREGRRMELLKLLRERGYLEG